MKAELDLVHSRTSLCRFLVLAIFGGRFPRACSAVIGAGSVGLSFVAAAAAASFRLRPPPAGRFTLVLWQWVSRGRVLAEHLLHRGCPLRGHDPRGDGRRDSSSTCTPRGSWRMKKATAGSSPT